MRGALLARAAMWVEAWRGSGTKHIFATDAAACGVSERALQAFLGHADARSTRRHARIFAPLRRRHR